MSIDYGTKLNNLKVISLANFFNELLNKLL